MSFFEVSYRKKLRIHCDYLVGFLGALVIGLFYFRPWTYSKRFVFPTGTDWVWQQAIFQMHGQIGLFGETHHLAWPVGADPWRMPQLGMLVGGWARVTVGWLGMGTASSIVAFISVAAAINAVALIYFIRGVIGFQFRVPTVCLSTMLAASLFTFSNQVNLSSFFIIPLAFGILWRLRGATKKRKFSSIAFLAMIAIVSPLWWVIVLLWIFPFVAFSHLLRRQWEAAKDIGLVCGAGLIGLLVQAFVHSVAVHGGPGADKTRTPWMSNALSGHFADFFVGSPIFRNFFPGVFDRVRVGASPTVSFGIPLLLGALVAVIAIFALPSQRDRPGVDLTHLTPITLTTLIYWLGGGFGNLQAAVAVVLNTASPARVWLRMILVLSILGIAWILIGLQYLRDVSARFRERFLQPASVFLAVLFIFGGLGDLHYADRNWDYKPANSEQMSTPAVDYIVANTKPCRVVQFPNEAFTNFLIALPIADNRLYGGMIPYILEPNYKWTAGSYDPQKNMGLSLYPNVIGDADFLSIEEDNFCAVLYDKSLGQFAITSDIAIGGREIRVTRRPDYEDSKYAVFILKNG